VNRPTLTLEPTGGTPSRALDAEAAPDAYERIVPSSQLLPDGRSLHISHNGCVYRLQATRLGKLILTK
jgi:hemin uptake protein HemP